MIDVMNEALSLNDGNEQSLITNFGLSPSSVMIEPIKS